MTLNKKLRANGVSLSVQLRSFLLNEQHFKDLTLMQKIKHSRKVEAV